VAQPPSAVGSGAAELGRYISGAVQPAPAQVRPCNEPLDDFEPCFALILTLVFFVEFALRSSILQQYFGWKLRLNKIAMHGWL
jgi:hypothetical protein